MLIFRLFIIFSYLCSRNPKHVRIMTTFALNNLWAYIEGLSLKQKDREWLAGKLLEPKTDDAKTARQQAYVKESLTRALQEVKAAKREDRKLKSFDEFLEELEEEDVKV